MRSHRIGAGRALQSSGVPPRPAAELVRLLQGPQPVPRASWQMPFARARTKLCTGPAKMKNTSRMKRAQYCVEVRVHLPSPRGQEARHDPDPSRPGIGTSWMTAMTALAIRPRQDELRPSCRSEGPVLEQVGRAPKDERHRQRSRSGRPGRSTSRPGPAVAEVPRVQRHGLGVGEHREQEVPEQHRKEQNGRGGGGVPKRVHVRSKVEGERPVVRGDGRPAAAPTKARAYS